MSSSISDLLGVLEQEFTDVFASESCESDTNSAQELASLTDSDLAIKDIETLMTEDALEQVTEVAYQTHVQSLIQYLERSLELVSQLKQQRHQDHERQDQRSRLAVLQTLAAQITYLLDQLSTPKGA